MDTTEIGGINVVLYFLCANNIIINAEMEIKVPVE